MGQLTSQTSLDFRLTAAARRFGGWLYDNRLSFGLKRASNALRQLALLKPFAEYVLCNELLLSYGMEAEGLTENIEWAWNEIEGGSLLARILLARPDAFCVASAYAPFCRLGYRSQRLDNILRNISMMRGTQVAEMQTWMRLGFHYAMKQIDSRWAIPRCTEATWLRALPEPWCINDDILYSVTHEVFYASDFGRSECNCSIEEVAYLELWLPVWIRNYIEQENWDLTSELIMVADCLPVSVWKEDPINHLLQQQQEEGHVRGTHGAGGLFVHSSESDQQNLFFNDYHTTLVGAMAVGLRLSRSVVQL